MEIGNLDVSFAKNEDIGIAATRSAQSQTAHRIGDTLEDQKRYHDCQRADAHEQCRAGARDMLPVSGNGSNQQEQARR